ncbi:MAG: DUF3267 domain-containing protein [Chloroflexi bacterium]|nr:DUF3267 domain-containing protein [Chloroflexota bacterium]
MNKRDLSISIQRANSTALYIGIPVVVFQFTLFSGLHNGENTQTSGSFLLFLVFVLAGVVVHEIIHGLTWMIFGSKPFSIIKFGFQWKAMTPYAHLSEPIDVSAYRIGAIMPGIVLGIIPYLLSLVLGNGNLLWFSMIHLTAAGGDWLVLWLLRKVKRGTLVEDHPTQAGCYVYETS